MTARRRLDVDLLRLPEVVRRTGLSKSEIYRRIRAGAFPAPNKLGARTSVWPSTTITFWNLSQTNPDLADLL